MNQNQADRWNNEIRVEALRKLLCAATGCDVNEVRSKRGRHIGNWPCRTCVMDLLGVDDPNCEEIPIECQQAYSAYLWVRGFRGNLVYLPEDITDVMELIVRRALHRLNATWEQQLLGLREIV